MKVEQIYTGCLAQGAYYITSNGEAAIVDPLREIKPYLERAKKDGVEIKYIFETHFHADFVSGHVDLAKATGAKIIYGPTAQPAFDCIIAKDGEEFKVGDLTSQNSSHSGTHNGKHDISSQRMRMVKMLRSSRVILSL
jgi:hydroxyacylglutathione hydrolase